MKTEQIYRVYTYGGAEGERTVQLGYAKGELDDIKAFYGQHYFGLKIEPAILIHVTPESVLEKKTLVAEREALKERLKTLDAVLMGSK